ncbi:MAG: type I DNA topoisomerase [Acidobacteriota bacterium]
MAEALVIVESPAKARTLKKFLGRKYRVESSMGHVRDLPKSNLGVDIDDDFKPQYEVIETRQKVVDKLTSEVEKVERILVATDPDREGEAIGWHLAEVLGKGKPVMRVAFNEITKHAVEQALGTPTVIDTKRVDAQQARRILDRLMGYRLSPLLWDKVRRGLSAGRVQSVALRIVCEREEAIEAFKPREYWVVSAELEGPQPPPFTARLKKKDGAAFEPANVDEWKAIETACKEASWSVTSVEKKQRKRNPQPPFTTSKFQQEASRRLRMPVRKAMQVAQALYEGKSVGDRGQIGLITYMRTDSTRISDLALTAVREHVEKRHGKDFLPDKPNSFRTKKGAQDAHEAIRPTYMDLPPEKLATYLKRDELSVYTMIWRRFVASQMKPALFDETIVEATAEGHVFEAKGSVLAFPGFLKLYTDANQDEDDDSEEGKFPVLEVGQDLKLHELQGEQKWTQPPPRFTEATLVKELEENGIGRPSTYASILSTLAQREYTVIREGKFHPTELGKLVTELLVTSFGDLLDVGYTARLEAELDEIAEGQRDWIQSLGKFNGKFVADLEKAQVEMRNVKAEAIETDEKCDECSSMMLLRWGRFGRFLACSNYPECKHTREQDDDDAPTFDEDCIYCSNLRYDAGEDGSRRESS